MSLNTVFNGLPSPNCLREVGELYAKEISQMGSIICNYHLEGKYGIGILHNHYHINEKERVVRTIVGETLVVQPLKGLDENTSPYLWKIGDDGEWLPLEYEYKNQTSGFSDESQEGGFKLAISKFILDNQLQHAFGVLKLNRSTIPSDAFHYLEDTDCEARVSILRLTPNAEIQPSDMYSSFIFSKDSSQIVFAACPTLCKHHDTHAGTPKVEEFSQIVFTACPTLCKHHDTHAGKPN